MTTTKVTYWLDRPVGKPISFGMAYAEVLIEDLGGAGAMPAEVLTLAILTNRISPDILDGMILQGGTLARYAELVVDTARQLHLALTVGGDAPIDLRLGPHGCQVN